MDMDTIIGRAFNGRTGEIQDYPVGLRDDRVVDCGSSAGKQEELCELDQDRRRTTTGIYSVRRLRSKQERES